MNARELIITLVGACSDRAECGGTSLQKMSYFAAHLLGIDLGHRAYYSGPFSDLVEQEVSSLALGGQVSEEETVVGQGPRGPVRRYRYSLTEQGRNRLNVVREQYPDEADSLYELVDRVVDIVGSLDPALLSQAAETFFIAEATGENTRFDELKQIAVEHGWDVKDSQWQAMDRLLEALD